jgi:predicted ATPase/class 3 adenylate cyclase
MNAQAGGPVTPSGIVTFLFTDIEGSTRRWEADPDLMRSALEAHDAVLREAIEKYSGWLFKHTGDGVCAAFSSPRAAVDAAIAAQRALELPVRMGIATGEAEHRGADYFGTALNRASRVMAAGHGGQILLDGLTAELLSGIELIRHGPQRLRDIAKPVDIHQVHAPGLLTEFAPLITLDTARGNLRAYTTSFVGRGRELADVSAAMRTRRLVTLTGVGGVGKTRLALEVAARVAADFPDGVWVIPLAAVGDPAAVPDAVAAVLGIKQQPGMTLSDSVATTLEGRTRLLVLDNCEHVLDAAADLIETILARSATVRILATSREGLGVVEEQLWPVPSLELDAGAGSAAATLFVERAHDVAPDISLADPDETSAVAEICRRLDGIPLAIELAASRMVSMTAVEVRDRLDDRFRLLIGSRRGLERHQTLRHAVQWSYDLLDGSGRELLARCSVFAGGFDLAAACAVAGSPDELATLDQLDALVRKSLLVADRTSGRMRFAMLETIRQFAEEQLTQGDSADEIRNAHAAYFAGREAGVMATWDGPRQRDSYTWFHLELANLRAAFRWAADNRDLDNAAAIAVYAAFLGQVLERHEPIAWAEELIGPAKAVQHRRLAQLYVMASQCHEAGRYADFLEYAAAAEAAADSGRFDPVPDHFESGVASGYLTSGQPRRCVELCRKLIARSPDQCPYSLVGVALGLSLAGSDDEAMATTEGFRTAADATSNPGLACFMLFAYGLAHRDARPAAAYEALDMGLTIARDSGNRQVESGLLVGLARLAASHPDPTDAFDLLTLALRRYQDYGSFSLILGPLAILTTLLSRLGLHEPAAIISHFADTPFTRAAYPELTATITHLGELLGAETYSSLAGRATSMTSVTMATYAFDQIDQARAAVLP